MNIIQVINDKINTKFDGLIDVSSSGRIKPWREHKMNNLKLYDLLLKVKKQNQHIMSDNRLFDLLHCGDTLIFNQYEDGSKKLKSANFCRIRICSMCQWRRSLKFYSQVSKMTNKLLQDMPFVRFLFITLTVKNCSKESLNQTIDKMNDKFKYIVAQNRTFKPADVLKKNLLGYIKTIEVTYNRTEDTYHPHIHCILAVKPAYFCEGYIKQSAWRIIWQEALKVNYLPQVNIKVIHGNKKAVSELVKYPLKTTDIFSISDSNKQIEVLETFMNVLYKRRFISFGGLFRTIRKELRLQDIESQNVNLVDTDELDKNFNNPINEILYKYDFRFGVYVSE